MGRRRYTCDGSLPPEFPATTTGPYNRQPYFELWKAGRVSNFERVIITCVCDVSIYATSFEAYKLPEMTTLPLHVPS